MIMLNTIVLNLMKHNSLMQSVSVLHMLNVINTNVVMQSSIMLSVIVLNVVIPSFSIF